MQISDPHFGTEIPVVVDALVDFKRSVDPDVVVLSGDITQRASTSQFAAARAFVERLAPRALVAIPGNHDIPLFDVRARVLSPYANYARALGADLEPEFEAHDLVVVAINTTRPYRHKNGEVSREQAARVVERLKRAAPAQLRIVVVHQPVLAIRDTDEENLLRGREVAVAAWAAAGCDIVMGGHIHLPYVRLLRPAYPYIARDVWTVQAGTAVSDRIRDGIQNSVNLIRCNGAHAPRECVVERWDFVPGARRFELHDLQPLRFEPD